MSKEIDIVPYNQYFVLKFTGGGELPDILKGYFTSVSKAEIAIQMYYESKKTKIKE